MLKALLISFIVAATADCGTHGGGTRPCANDPTKACTDCGNDPCVDVDGVCWSCSGSDGTCYPYDCGTTCSTAPCSSVEATSNSVSKKMNNNGTKKTARAAVQHAAPVMAKSVKAEKDGRNGCCAIVNNVCCPSGNACEQSGMACSCDPSQCSA